jgi:hypothetical protein
MATYVPDMETQAIARNLMRRYSYLLGELNIEKIGFLKELDSPSKTKLAVTKRVDGATKIYYSDKDYIIIFFDQRWQELTPAQRNILVLHELMHCQADGESMRAHDVQDFYEIAAAFGADWCFNPTVRDPLGEEKVDLISKPANYGDEES